MNSTERGVLNRALERRSIVEPLVPHDLMRNEMGGGKWLREFAIRSDRAAKETAESVKSRVGNMGIGRCGREH